MRRRTPSTILFGLVLWVSPSAAAQESPFLDPTTYRFLDNELSGDIAKDNLAILTRFHRPGGSRGFHEAAEFIVERARSYGLEDIHIIRQESRATSWSPGHSELWMIEPEEIKLADNREVATFLADHSRPADVTAELVDVGRGDTEADYEGRDVAGKLVLANGIPQQVMAEAVYKRGALGIVSYFSTRLYPLAKGADQVSWWSIEGLGGTAAEPSENEPTFAFMISPRTAQWIKSLLGGGLSRDIFNIGMETPQKVMLRARVDATLEEERWQEMIEYVLPGSEIHDQDIVLTAHLQEEKFSANDDGSGCVNLLELARVLNHLIESGNIERPRRDIRFWWTTEISSEYRYFADHPEERAQFLANINQDMVGANQSQDNRVQHVTRTPYSIPSFLSDVVESITESFIWGNSAFLSVRQAGRFSRGTHFSRPILSRLGTRDRYNAMVVPYFDSTDHLVFCDSIIGIPGVTLTNWPDEFIHSSDDDLWNVDATQLKRNAFLVAAAALYLANAGDSQVPTLASEIYGRATGRIADDVRTAAGLVLSASDEEVVDRYHDAANLIHQAVRRERKALGTVEVLASDERSGSGNLLDHLSRLLAEKETESITLLDRVYENRTGEAEAPAPSLSAKQQELAGKVPRKTGTVGEYILASRSTQAVKGLHPLMQAEILNFVDGERTALEIYHAVRAESLSVGEFYYGRVNPQMVDDLLANAVASGAIELR